MPVVGERRLDNSRRLPRFFVTFPTPKRVSENRIAAWLVYDDWGCLLVFLLAELLVPWLSRLFNRVRFAQGSRG